MQINEVIAKTALSKSSLSGLVYALNPYKGCEHACVYCYAPFVLRERRKWGEFVDVKTNLPDVLKKEAEHKEKGTIGIGTVTDPYQPVEKKYEITRKCLEVLLKKDWPITIQTKSDLVLRDLDLIEKFSERDIGFTITTLDDNARQKFEPHASAIKNRLKALEKIAERGIETWAFIGPIIPDLIGDTLEEIIKRISKAGVDHILYDKLNIKPWMKGFSQYRSVDYNLYEEKIKELCKHYNVRCHSAF
jgi:DNA repair photolyase